jgi:hypothetical protein
MPVIREDRTFWWLAAFLIGMLVLVLLGPFLFGQPGVIYEQGPNLCGPIDSGPIYAGCLRSLNGL